MRRLCTNRPDEDEKSLAHGSFQDEGFNLFQRTSYGICFLLVCWNGFYGNYMYEIRTLGWIISDKFPALSEMNFETYARRSSWRALCASVLSKLLKLNEFWGSACYRLFMQSNAFTRNSTLHCLSWQFCSKCAGRHIPYCCAARRRFVVSGTGLILAVPSLTCVFNFSFTNKILCVFLISAMLLVLLISRSQKIFILILL